MEQWSRVLENLIVTQLVKKVPALYGTWRFVTMFTRAHQVQGPVQSVVHVGFSQ